MEKFIINGVIPLHGTVLIGGAKNVALKTFVAAILTDEPVVIHNVPLIRDVSYMLDVLRSLGASVEVSNHTVRIQNCKHSSRTVPLEVGARLRTSSMVIGPLLSRYGEAKIPNPGGCRIGARPIDRHIDGLTRMGAAISYHSEDGYFYAKADKLHGTTYQFPKNTHTGTETLLLAAVLAEGETMLRNAAEEVEIDDLINVLLSMGADISRPDHRTIRVRGVKTLSGSEYTIMPDRNVEVTFALAAAITGGTITVGNSKRVNIQAFLDMFRSAGGLVKEVDDNTTTYSGNGNYKATHIVTAPDPGFMTDWQAPWAVFMTKASGESTIHETVFESRFSYVAELNKMGAGIEFFDPQVDDPDTFYNFNWSDHPPGYHQGIRIHGPTTLHNAILEIDDLRAGATLVLAALAAKGESYVHGVEILDRGYENFEESLKNLGANVTRVKEEI